MGSKDNQRLKVAMIATPWLRIPPDGYGGIEVVLDAMIRGLNAIGVTVDLFTVPQTNVTAASHHSLYENEMFHHIHRPLYENAPIVLGHLQHSINTIIEQGDYDVIHDHNAFIGPSLLHNLSLFADLPPIIHTVHGPPFDYSETDLHRATTQYWQQFKPIDGRQNRLFFVGISEALMAPAAEEIKRMSLPPVHNGVYLEDFVYEENKKDYFLTLARFCEDKGQHIAAELAAELKQPLKMAGTVADIDNVTTLSLELANPHSKYRQSRDFRYYSDKILPYIVKHRHINYVGNLKSRRKFKTIANAKALLFPITWDEPFGMSVIEALASGTPVIAMNRGAMPEIIEHEVSGFLANDIDEFRSYMQRIDEIDPAACRARVQAKFSANAMATAYADRYRQAISLVS